MSKQRVSTVDIPQVISVSSSNDCKSNNDNDVHTTPSRQFRRRPAEYQCQTRLQHQQFFDSMPPIVDDRNDGLVSKERQVAIGQWAHEPTQKDLELFKSMVGDLQRAKSMEHLLSQSSILGSFVERGVDYCSQKASSQGDSEMDTVTETERMETEKTLDSYAPSVSSEGFSAHTEKTDASCLAFCQECSGSTTNSTRHGGSLDEIF